MQCAELLDDLRDGSLHRVLVSDIDFPEGDLVRAQFFDQLVGALLVQVENGNLYASGNIGFHGGLAKTGRAASDNGYFSFEIH